MDAKIKSLRMERQCFIEKADIDEYQKLYRDTQPGQSVYWNGFGQAPTLTFRADFDDIEFNRNRQLDRRLIKGRFAGGNLGWIVPEDIELFIALYRKPLTKPTIEHLRILEMIETMGPLNIQQIKEETGLLVKQVTPILHRLQEAFLIYEDQYDGEWDRGWYKFVEMFPDVDYDKYSRLEALKIVMQRFAFRVVWFDIAMVKSFYKVPEKEIKLAVSELIAEGILVASDSGYILMSDANLLKSYEPKTMNFVYAIHRRDFIYKVHEHILKDMTKKLTDGLEYDHEPLQYLLIDGEFHGASVGHFRNGPYDLNDIVCDLPDADRRKNEIIEAVRAVNFGKMPQRFMGKEFDMKLKEKHIQPIFRKAKFDEAKEIEALYKSVLGSQFCVWNEHYPSMQEITCDLETENLYILTMEDGIIGALSIVPENELDEFSGWSCKDGTHREIARVVISKSYQGYGFAQRMIHEIQSILKHSNCSAIHLSVAKSNIPAYKTYLKIGFTVQGEADMYGNSYYLMEKQILR